MPPTMMLTAAATVSLTGPLALQGRQAARGLELWASADQIQLQIVDDAGSPTTARNTYRRWLGGQVDLLLGPYGSGLVRQVGPIVTRHGTLLWNHGGAADDLTHPLVVPVSTPASTYFRGAVELTHRRGLPRVVFAQGRGRFASAVISGAHQRATDLGLAVRDVPLAELATAGSLTEAAVLIVGTFTEDLAVVEQIRAGPEPGLLGCVAAGLLEFGKRLGPTADGVVGPVQWISDAATPQVGPAGADFSHRHQSEHGEPPDYVAAQAAAAGYLAAEAHRRRYQHHQLKRWKTTTLLDNFALDQSHRALPNHHRVATRSPRARHIGRSSPAGIPVFIPKQRQPSMVKVRSIENLGRLASTPCSRLWSVSASPDWPSSERSDGPRPTLRNKTSAAATLTVPPARDRHEFMRLDSGLTIAASRAWRS